MIKRVIRIVSENPRSSVFVSIISLLIIVSAYFFYQYEVSLIVNDNRSDLKAISNLKAEQLIRWREERIADAAVVSTTSFIINDISELINNHDSLRAKRKLAFFINKVRTAHKYNNIFILSPTGEILFAIDNEIQAISESTASQLKTSAEKKQPLITDFYYCETEGRVHLDIIAPVRNAKRELIAFLLFRVNPEDYLYPFIQAPYSSKKTSETSIFKKDGDYAIYLNELRNRSNTALKLKHSLQDTIVPIVKGVLGARGFVNGVDYRGEKVIAYICAIPQSNWLLLTKIDEKEAFASLSSKALLTSLSVLLIIFLIIYIAAFNYSNNKRKYFRELWERDATYKTTLYSIGDAVITTDKYGRIRQLNKVAEELTEWTERAAFNKELPEVFNIICETNRKRVENPVEIVLQKGLVVGLANHTLLISKTGKEIPIADSGAPIFDANNEITGVVLVFRDQTEERNKQEELEKNELKYRRLFESTLDGICLHEMVFENGIPVNYRILDTNKKYEEILGLKQEDVIGKLATDIYAVSEAPFLKEYSKVAISGEPYSFEEFFPAMQKYFSISVFSPEKNKFATIFQDITQRKEIEKLLSSKLHKLTNPNIGIDDIEFNDLFNLDEIQKLQDQFSLSANVASLITTPNGTPITKPSNFCLLCNDIIRKTEDGSKNCQISDSIIGRRNEDGPIVQPCLSGGLYDAGASIVVGGKHIANWLVGQVRDESIHEEKIWNYAIEIGADPEKAVAAFKEVPVMSKAQFEKIAETLYTITKIISEAAIKNLLQAKIIADKEKAELALKKSETDYYHLFNSVSEAIYIQDTQGRFLDVNKGAEIMYGYPREYFIGRTPEFISAENKNDHKAVLGMVAKAFEGIPQIFEYWGKRSNGEEFPKEVKLYPGNYNNQEAVIAIATDITFRKRAELIQEVQFNIAKAVVSSKNLEELFNSIKDELSLVIDCQNIFIAFYNNKKNTLYAPLNHDEKDDILEWSAEKSLTGYLIRQQKTILISKSDYYDLVELGEVEQIGTIPEIWLGAPLSTREQSIGAIAVQSYSNPNAYNEESAEIFSTIANQLSIYIEHKRAEEEKAKLAKAIVQSPVIIVITDRNGNIEFVNPKFTYTTGYSAEEAYGKNPNILKSGFHNAEFYLNMWATIQMGNDWKGELKNKKKDGSLYWENAFISPIFNEAGEITHFLAVKEDITEKKEIINQLIIAKEKAEEMNKMKSNFLANMSHEIRTPFNGILGFAELLKEALENENELKQMADAIHKSGRRLLETLNLILNFSKLEAERVDVHLEPVNIVPLVEDTCNLFSVLAQKKGLELKKIINDSDICIHIDVNMLNSILTNLINNAIKYTESGSVTIKVQKINSEVEISVIDTGIGIPDNKQELIWEEFRQVSEGIGRSFEGTGLGLTITKKYTNLLNGQISMTSKYGVGSTFVVKFPLSEYEPVVSSKKTYSSINAAMDNTYDSPTKKLLYVEDDTTSISVVTMMLKDVYHVDTAKNAEAALLLVEENKYDGILMDINLSRGMDGIQLTQILRKRPDCESIPIIAVTAYALDEDKKEFLSKGMTHYISKPFLMKDLLALLKLVFEG